MEEYIQELAQNDGVEDAGTIRYDSEDENKVQCIYPASKIKIDRVQFSIFELSILLRQWRGIWLLLMADRD